MSASTAQTDLSRVFGFDLAALPTAPGIDLATDVAFAGGDLVTVSGVDALDQGLTLAILTRLGDRIFDSGYGFDGLRALGDETNPVLVRERVRISLIATLSHDPRVRAISDVQLETEVFTRTLSVQISFTTIAGTQAVVNLNGVIPGA